jgi:hypothetical protein
MKTTKTSVKKSAKSTGRARAKSGIRGGVVKCTASKTARDGTTCTVEGTCDVSSAKVCEEQLKGVLA